MTPQLSKEVLGSLIERVGKASGEDRSLDDAIGAALEFQYDGAALVRNMTLDGVGCVRFEAPGGWEEVPHYTSSADDALALVERLLGTEAQALCYSYDLGWHASAHAHMSFTADLHLAVGNPVVMQTTHGQSHSLPLAILHALLLSLLEHSK